jgi:hypothetical protein
MVQDQNFEQDTAQGEYVGGTAVRLPFSNLRKLVCQYWYVLGRVSQLSCESVLPVHSNVVSPSHCL